MHAGQLRSFFASASEYVSECGYQDERKWYSNLRFETVTERQLLCESAWVILCSGFRENTVRRCFGYISWCFLDWISSTEIVGSADRCIGLATLRFRHEGKLRAIVSVAQKVSEVGFENIKTRVSQNPIDTLQEFPYVGRVTAFHLAKNLGLPFAKPDRHMEALRKKLGFPSVEEFCQAVAGVVDLPIHIVDTVLWRFCALGGSKLVDRNGVAIELDNS